MKLTFRDVFPYLLVLLGGALALTGTGLLIASFDRPALRGAAVGAHLAGWSVLLFGLRRLYLQITRPGPIRVTAETPDLESGDGGLSIAAAPRPTHFRAGIRLARWLFLLALAGWSGYSAWSAWTDLSELTALRARGLATQAQIINNVTLTGQANYAFYVRGVSVTGHFPVAASEYARYRLGTFLPVTYLPAAPQIHRRGAVTAAKVRQQALTWALVALQGLLAIGLPFALLELRWQRELRLARWGLAARGLLTASRPIRQSRYGTLFETTYEFSLPSGGLQTGRACLSRRDDPPPTPGDALPILYDPAHPEQNLPAETLRLVVFAGQEKPVFRTVRYDL